MPRGLTAPSQDHRGSARRPDHRLEHRTGRQTNSDPTAHALIRYAFNPTARCRSPAPALASRLRWGEAHSLALTVAAEPTHLRRALDAISVKLDGAPAAAATLARKRATSMPSSGTPSSSVCSQPTR